MKYEKYLSYGRDTVNPYRRISSINLQTELWDKVMHYVPEGISYRVFFPMAGSLAPLKVAFIPTFLTKP